jgi:hypothetical protein
MKDELTTIILGAAALQGLAPRDRQAAFDALPEGARLRLVARAGAVPADCGPAITPAPARGPVRVFDLLESYPDGPNGSRLKPAGFAGRRSLQRLDVFGRMTAQAARRGGDCALSDSQIGMGRMYRSLVETQAAGGLRCAALEGGRGGTAEGFTDHRLDQSRRIDALHAKIGLGVALAVRRVRPSVRGVRTNIPDRALVDAVCLLDRDLSVVLADHGWSIKGETLRAAQAALAAALDRMIGPARSPRIEVVWLGGRG